MLDRLHQVFEYRTLLNKRDAARRLTLEEQERLDFLGQVLAPGIPTAGDPNPGSRLESPIDVSVSAGGQRIYGTLLNASADGFGIVLDPPPPLGQRAVVNVSMPMTGTQYQFPGRVVARVVKGMTSVGIALQGDPTRVQMDRQHSGVWRHQDTIQEFSGRSLGKTQQG